MRSTLPGTVTPKPPSQPGDGDQALRPSHSLFHLQSSSERPRADPELTPAGGWLADLLILFSQKLRVWEPFLAALVFLASWVALRLSSRSTAFVLAAVYDWTIPIQCARNSHIRSDVADHLRIYWRVWVPATALELIALLLLSEGSGLRLICAKTTLMIVLWLARLDEGFVSQQTT